MKKKTKDSLIYGALGALAGYYLLPVVAEKVGFGALALKANGLGALAYRKNRRNPRYGALAMKKNGYGAVHKMGMHPMGAIHMNPGHMGAIQMGAIHTNPHSLLGEFSARNALHHM